MNKRSYLYLALGGVVLGACLMEYVARSFLGLGTPLLWQVHPTIEYIAKPNQEVQRFGNRMFVNSFGMRSHEFDAVKAAGEFRVLCFGDSILYGGALVDQDDIATSRLRVTLQNTVDTPVTVGNVSAKSWGPGNWLAYAEEYGFFDADVIVLVLSSHDYGDNPRFDRLDPKTYPTETPASAFVEGLTTYLPRYLPFETKVAEEEDELNLDAEYATSRSDLLGFLRHAQTACEDVLVFNHLEKGELRSGKLDAGGEALQSIVEEAGLTLYSMRPFYESYAQKEATLYQDGIHLNVTGHLCLAEGLFETIQKNSP